MPISAELLRQRTQLLAEFQETCPTPKASFELYGKALTEGQNPKTMMLSQTTETSMSAALDMIRAVELSALEAFEKAPAEAKSDESILDEPSDNLASALAQIKTAIKAAIDEDRNFFLVGCGASGRMVMLIQRLLQDQFPALAHKIKVVMAGGDVALANALARYEDNTLKAEAQLDAQGFKPGDSVIGFSASGTAKFVQTCVNRAATTDPKKGIFVCCNKASAVRNRAKDLGLSALQKPETTIVSALSESPAIAGSTRLHPTTLMSLICYAIVQAFSETKPGKEKPIEGQLALFKEKLATLPLDQLAAFADREAATYKSAGKVFYKVGKSSAATKTSIYTDLTERNPTFNLPRLGRLTEQLRLIEDHTDHAAWSWLAFEEHDEGTDVWRELAGSRDLVKLNDPDFPETESGYLAHCDYGAKAGSRWKSAWIWRGIDVHDVQMDEHDEGFRISYGEGADLQVIQLETAGLEPLFKQLLLKVVLNMHSSATLANCGLCYGNVMTNLSPSNVKLVARAELQCQQYYRDYPTPGVTETLIREQLCEAVKTLEPGKSIFNATIERCKSATAPTGTTSVMGLSDSGRAAHDPDAVVADAAC